MNNLDLAYPILSFKCWMKVTDEDCFMAGYRHGMDGMFTYPPSRWGLDENHRYNPAGVWFDAAYLRGHRAGVADKVRQEGGENNSHVKPVSP